MHGLTRPRVMILGGAGMLGHKLVQELGARFPGTVATVREPAGDPWLARVPILQGDHVRCGVDALDFARTAAVIREVRPDVLVNCVGVIKQRPGAKDAIPSLTLNALLPHRLALLLEEWGGRLIHFSTDCVFSGRGGLYTEDSVADAVDLYGRTKHLGEVDAANALVIRSSIIGRELKHFASLIDWFLARAGGRVGGYTRVVYSGVTTRYMARLVGDLIERHPDLRGLWQLASVPIAKHDLLLLVREAYGLDIAVDPDDTVVLDRSLDGRRFATATGIVVPSWPELVADMAADPTPYAQWRQQS
ncbi:MAG: SDR family oxidoreductase [Krumholzibacteria bacterium]|nr:SDR family oxidoreductase [Candidatus Krumholzibacteria bacterium]